MNNMLDNNVIKPEAQEKAQHIANVITSINPDILGMSEAANALAEH